MLKYVLENNLGDVLAILEQQFAFCSLHRVQLKE